jgi:hypothetical protein
MRHQPTVAASDGTEEVNVVPHKAGIAMSDTRRLIRTATPGIYRKGSRYVVVYRAGGKQRKEFARTLAEARQVRAARVADDARGEFQVRTTIRLREFLSEWIDRYQGTGKRGFRERTRGEYRRLLDEHAHRYFGERVRLVDVTPHALAQFVAWLTDEAKRGRRYSDATVRNIVIPVRAALATAQREGLIRHNPAQGLALPHRPAVLDDDEDPVKALSRDQIIALIAMTPDRYRLLVELIASTGLRISEAVGLQRKHLALDGSRAPCEDPPRDCEGARRASEDPSRSAQRAARSRACVQAAGAPGRTQRRTRAVGVPVQAEHTAAAGQPAEAGVEAADGADRRTVGRLARAAPQLRLDHARERREHRRTLARAGPPLARLHPQSVHAPARRRRSPDPRRDRARSGTTEPGGNPRPPGGANNVSTRDIRM